MSDFGSCDFGAISPDLVLRSLLSGITSGVSCGVRIVEVSVIGKTISRPIACASHEDVWSLFARSLMMADDGKVAIRAAKTTSADGAGLENCVSCESGFTLWDYASSVFSQDEDGKVYMNIINIT